VSYYVRLGVGSQQGDGINRAYASFTDRATGSPRKSNTAQARVMVTGGVLGNESCVIGKVYMDCNGNHVQDNVGGSNELGIPGVRLVNLDGTFVVTDAEGKFNMCGLRPQTHVLRVDRTTLPRGSRLLPSSNRNAGDGGSIFVDLKGGELHRADFIEGSCSPEVLDQVKARRAAAGASLPEVETKAPALKLTPATGQLQQQVMPETRTTQSGATSGGRP
jgi:hypothetical protein